MPPGVVAAGCPSARNALIAAFGSTLVATAVRAGRLPARRLQPRICGRRPLEPGAPDALQGLGALGWAGGLAPPVASDPYGLRRPGPWVNRKRARDLSSGRHRCSPGSPSGFAWLLVAVSSPFNVVAAAADGRGLTRAFRTRTWSAGTVLLYLGYVGLAVPFAFAMGARSRAGRTAAVDRRNPSLDARRLDGPRVRSTARSPLGLPGGRVGGRLRGGSGGECGADAVARCDGVPAPRRIQEKRGMLGGGTSCSFRSLSVSRRSGLLTRSGVATSIHSFTKSSIGAWFLAFIIIAVVFSIDDDLAAAPAAANHREARVAGLA